METDLTFRKFAKIPRLNRDMIITEKIDGTNAQIFIDQFANYEEVQWDMINKYDLISDPPKDKADYFIMAGSRKRWITPEDDNYGFAQWVKEHYKGLLQLGPGRHYGEWWGQGIQRKYGMHKKVFSLFNTHRWLHNRPVCCDVVPVLYEGPFSTDDIHGTLLNLMKNGSEAARKYHSMVQPAEGVIVYHKQGNTLFKATIEDDDMPKSLVKS
jgi:hypothetical protein